MVVANERDHYKEAILPHIRGIAFFGTPHQGSKLASWGMIVANIVDFATIGTNTNKGLIKALKDRSPQLYDISKSFVDRSGIPILTFYELDKLPNANFKVGFFVSLA